MFFVCVCVEGGHAYQKIQTVYVAVHLYLTRDALMCLVLWCLEDKWVVSDHLEGNGAALTTLLEDHVILVEMYVNQQDNVLLDWNQILISHTRNLIPLSRPLHKINYN